MNEFTKEELENIYESLMNTEIEVFEDLPSKVSLMINNYCDNENLKDVGKEYKVCRGDEIYDNQ